MSRHPCSRPALLAASLVLLLAPAVAIGAPAAAGHWEGRLEIPGSPLDMSVDLSQDAGASNGDVTLSHQQVSRWQSSDCGNAPTY